MLRRPTTLAPLPVLPLAWVLLSHCGGITNASSDRRGEADAGADVITVVDSADGLDATLDAPLARADATPESGTLESGRPGDANAGPDEGPEAAGSCVLPCDPGNVECAGAPCATPANACCYLDNDAGSFSATCDNAASTCVMTGLFTGGFTVGCDEAADCLAGQVCCFSWFPPGTQCVTACTAHMIHVMICKTDAECNGAPCIAVTCPAGSPLPAVGTCGGTPCPF
jgi:hypothetical protein